MKRLVLNQWPERPEDCHYCEFYVEHTKVKHNRQLHRMDEFCKASKVLCEKTLCRYNDKGICGSELIELKLEGSLLLCVSYDEEEPDQII